uniref:Transcription initiation factor TFIID subunit 4 n=1 Tax=Heterorhabditis bacteriophora TaxID=37862 RepID=A0A1I7XBA5_HETBA
MDDLLSVALSEAGLDEFLTPVINSPTENGCIPLASSSTPEGSYAPSTSSLSPSGVPSGISTTPSPAVTPASNIQSDIFEDSLSNCQSIQGTSTQSQSQTVSASTTAPLSTTNTPTNSVQNMGRVQLQSQQFTYEKSCATPPTPPIAGGVQVRTSYTTAPLSGGQAIKRIVQTPDGPKTQLLRPYVNEKGQTIYRAVRTVPVISGVAARTFSVSGTSGNPTRVVVNRSTGGTTVIDQNGHPQRIVVVRQNTPSGPVLVRKAIPAGSSVTTSSSGRGGTIIRRVVTRGGQQMEIATQPTSTFSDRNIINVKGSRLIEFHIRTTSPSSHSQVHVETGHQYASTLSPPPISRVSSTPSVRGLSRNNINRGSSIRGATVYRPLTQPSSQLLSRTSGGALVGSVSSTLQRQKMANKIHSVRSAAGAESLGTLEHMDVKRVQSPGPGRPTPKPATPTTPVSMKLTTKSQKAKDEMKSAMQTAAEKRAEIDEEVNCINICLIIR